jgi:hypothetical protein
LAILFGKGEYIDEKTPIGGLICGGKKMTRWKENERPSKYKGKY